MWVALIVAILTYLMSPTDTSKQRKQALLNAALAGGATYAVAEYTDWGKENLHPFDKKVTGTFNPQTILDENGNPVPNPDYKPPATVKQSGSNGQGLWETIKSWGPSVVTAVGGASLASSINPWVLIAVIAGGAYLLLKD